MLCSISHNQIRKLLITTIDCLGAIGLKFLSIPFSLARRDHRLKAFLHGGFDWNDLTNRFAMLGDGDGFPRFDTMQIFAQIAFQFSDANTYLNHQALLFMAIL